MHGALLFMAMTLLRATAPPPTLEDAQRLAWDRHFAEAEQMYRAILLRDPRSEPVRIGLARVLLWEGHYREARAMFLRLASENPGNLDAAEGAATAAYWQGDFRTAAREFRSIAAAHPERMTASRDLHAIELASRDSERLLIDGIDDDQPYRLWRSEAEASIFTDPLTRWDITAGGYRADDPTLAAVRSEPFVSIANETVLPWQRLTIRAALGVLRSPDGTTRPTGSLSLRFRTGGASSFEIAADRSALLRTATAVRDHPAVTRMFAAWNRSTGKNWLAGFEGGSLRYFDRNRGWYAQGYGLWPVVRRGGLIVRAGASGALHDTRESRFYVEAITSQRSGAQFLYDYRGAYTPYWTPQDLREARAIVAASDAVTGRMSFRLQLEAGVARDRAEAFGPANGPSPLPPTIFTFGFRRTFHPTRISVGAALAVTPQYTLEISVQRETTVFYRANEFRASVVRTR